MYNELKQPIQSNLQNKKVYNNAATLKSLPKRANVETQASNIDTRNEILSKSLNNDAIDTLQKAIKKDNKRKNISNFGQLISGALKKENQVIQSIYTSNVKQKRTNISNFGKLASQTPKLKEVRQNKQIQDARKKYNKIGEFMSSRKENALRPFNDELIQSKARDKVKKNIKIKYHM